MAEGRTDLRRRAFAPIVLAGLAAAATTSYAGSKPWAAAQLDRVADVPALALTTTAGEAPAAGALALVVLASWGVLLVSRRRARRAAALLGMLAAVGTVVAVWNGWSASVASVEEVVRDAGRSDVAVDHTGWYWAAAIGAAASLVAAALAFWWCPSWPHLGSRYDAPTAARAATGRADESDMWQAIDEGRDPTA